MGEGGRNKRANIWQLYFIGAKCSRLPRLEQILLKGAAVSGVGGAEVRGHSGGGSLRSEDV